jgi:hypothetical protein
MRAIGLALAIALAAAVTGCSSISRNINFEPKSDHAFALLAADGMIVNGSQSYLFELRKVNLETSSFSKDGATINFSGMGPQIEGNEFQKPEQSTTTVRFGGKEIPPGDYALIARYDFASYGMANSTTVNCFALGAAVFHIRSGTINIVPGGHVRGGPFEPRPLQEQVSKVLSGYPKMTAPVMMAEPIGAITFQPGRGMLGAKNCNVSGLFQFTPRPSVKPAI